MSEPERLAAGKGNIICPGYEIHKPRILDNGEVFALTAEGAVVCQDCEKYWAEGGRSG
jgi:hypothetical protein